MFKKFAALAVIALFSLNASAGYVQYDLANGQYGSGLSGYIVQHDTDQSIAFFSFRLNDYVQDFGSTFSPFNNEGCICIVQESTYFRNNGPTNFVINDGFGADHATELVVNFSRSTQGKFSYTASYRADLYANMPPVIYTGAVSGFATRGTVDPRLASYLDSRGGYEVGVDHIVPAFIRPNQVPEPTSLALIALGVAGLAGFGRRKAAR